MSDKNNNAGGQQEGCGAPPPPDGARAGPVIHEINILVGMDEIKAHYISVAVKEYLDRYNRIVKALMVDHGKPRLYAEYAAKWRLHGSGLCKCDIVSTAQPGDCLKMTIPAVPNKADLPPKN